MMFLASFKYNVETKQCQQMNFFYIKIIQLRTTDLKLEHMDNLKTRIEIHTRNVS